MLVSLQPLVGNCIVEQRSFEENWEIWIQQTRLPSTISSTRGEDGLSEPSNDIVADKKYNNRDFPSLSHKKKLQAKCKSYRSLMF